MMSEPTRSRSLWKRCLREISKDTNATSHRNRGAASSSSKRPTCKTHTVSAPRATARSSGMLFTRPPSKKCSSPIRTGGNTPGSAHDARTGSIRSPVLNQCSRARSMLAATHSNGTARSSKVCAGNRSRNIRRSAPLPCKDVLRRTTSATRRITEPSRTPSSASASQIPNRCCAPSGVGSAAIAAPLIAPTEVPHTRSG